MAWWIWVILGIGLLVVEMATPGGLFALFFGAGALVVAMLALAGVGTIAQWIAFTAVSLTLLLTLRRRVQARLAGSPRAAVDSLVGEEVVLLADLPAGGEAKAELRGAPWNARAAADVSMRAGARARVERVDGLVLWIRAE
jgi:membrane protein implicated in regulation of membrane protease activity